MLTVVTPATSRDLTTIARANAVLGYAPPAILIEQASAMAAGYCRRTLVSETVLETFEDNRTWDIAHRRARAPMFLQRTPVTSITSFTVAGEVVDPDDYEIDRTTGRLVRWAAAALWSGDSWCSWWAGAAVQYVGGYTPPVDSGTPGTLPADLERAVILLIAAFKYTTDRDPLLRSESVDGVSSTAWWPKPTPSAVSPLPSVEAQQILMRYRAPLLG